MHLALASDACQIRSFAPEPFTMEFQAELEQSMRGLSGRVFAQLREKISGLPLNQQETAKRVSTQEVGDRKSDSEGVEQTDSRDAHANSWGLPFGAGAVYRIRFRDYRF